MTNLLTRFHLKHHPPDTLYIPMARSFSSTIFLTIFPAAVIVSLAIGPIPSPDPVIKPSTPTTHIQYFGFAIVDCGHDDPNDAEIKTNYTDEVVGLSNIAHIAAYDASASIEPRLVAMLDAGLAPMLDVSALLTVAIEDQTMPAGFRLEPRPNAEQILDDWYQLNHLDDLADQLAAVYLVDEPIWNGMTPTQIDSITAIVDAQFPSVPIAMIEAGLAVETMHIPAQVDWIGFDHYGIVDPATDPTYLNLVETMLNKRTRPDQRMIIVMESQWLDEYTQLGVKPEIMSTIANNYTALAINNPETIAILGYAWPGGLDPNQTGARDLPKSVHQTYRQLVRSLGLVN